MVLGESGGCGFYTAVAWELLQPITNHSADTGLISCVSRSRHQLNQLLSRGLNLGRGLSD